uniref:Dynein cytoplasmic 1 intermediate chain 1 n=1 Tax=Sinocyclocheilus rhinocerous TaxID=307959 RepID=A0A673HQE5_9TELE
MMQTFPLLYKSHFSYLCCFSSLCLGLAHVKIPKVTKQDQQSVEWLLACDPSSRIRWHSRWSGLCLRLHFVVFCLVCVSGHPRELTEEEKQQVLHSEEFLIFFDRSIRVIERALDKEGDLQGGSSLSLNRLFYDERWSKHQVITCLDWSSQYPELLVASYNNNEDAPHEPDDVALVWNMKFKKTTQRVHLPLPVVSVGFARFHPNLLVGGTYSGQIVLWDNRSHRRTPVQRTPLSAAAHTHPIYCVNVVGTQNASNLITASTDGRMCSWSLDMLSQPQSMELVYNKSKPVAVTGMVFPTGDVNNYIVGSEEGTVYTASRHGRLVAHTRIHLTHRPSNQKRYDVMWSPVHPSLFAAVDSMGRLDLWNLNNDTEVPTASVTIEGAPALNCIRWASGGKEVAVGDSEGRVWIYDVGEHIRMIPKGSYDTEDWSNDC